MVCFPFSTLDLEREMEGLDEMLMWLGGHAAW
jgi:hypothetical protein